MALVPAARWYWQDDSSPPKPYDAEQSAQLEAAFLNGAVEAVFFGNKYKINFPARRQTNVHTGFSRPVIRGTWFWRADNGTFVPYAENVATALERAFNAGQFINFQIQVDAERYVMLSPDGRHFQFRFNAPGRNGRQVLRGHNGQLVPATAQVAAPVVEVVQQTPVPVMPVPVQTTTVAPIATGQPIAQPAMGTPVGAQPPAMGAPLAMQAPLGAPAMGAVVPGGQFPPSGPAFSPSMNTPSIVTPGPAQFGSSGYPQSQPSYSTPPPTVNPQMTYMPPPAMSQPSLSPAPSPHTERRLSGGMYDLPHPMSQTNLNQPQYPQPGQNQFGQQLGQNQFGQVDQLQSQMSQLNMGNAQFGQPNQSHFGQSGTSQFGQSTSQFNQPQPNQFGQPQSQGINPQIPPTGFPPGFGPQGASQPATNPPSSFAAQPTTQYSGSSSYGASSTTQFSQNITSTTMTTTTTPAPATGQIPPSGFPPGFGPSSVSPSGQGYPPSTSSPQTAPTSSPFSSLGGAPSGTPSSTPPGGIPPGYPPGFNSNQ